MQDFYRYHGLGNDYLVIDPSQCRVQLTPENVRLICSRNFGIGSDGILYGPVKRSTESDALYFQIWNPDGSEAEKSGNGIRIFAQYLLDQGYVTASHFSLETLGGLVHIEVVDPESHTLKVEMGSATLHSEEIPVRLEKLSSYRQTAHEGEVLGAQIQAGKRQFSITCVSLGNPHCIVIPTEASEGISEEEARIYGPLLENHPAFPNRTNVQFLKLIDRHCIQIEIWERGAGYTLASGSSSCAAAVAAWRNGLVEPPVRVLMPGGEFTVGLEAISLEATAPVPESQWQHPVAKLELTGPVSGICSGMFHADLQKQLNLNS